MRGMITLYTRHNKQINLCFCFIFLDPTTPGLAFNILDEALIIIGVVVVVFIVAAAIMFRFM